MTGALREIDGKLYAVGVEISEYVTAYARSGSQAAVLQGNWRVFRSRSGAVPYRLHFGAALCPGEPLCPPAEAPRALAEFLEVCQRRRWHAVFAPVGRDFAVLVAERGGAAWKLGEEPLIEFAAWSQAGKTGARLRAALHRAQRLGVKAGEWWPNTGAGPSVEALSALHSAWLNHHGGPPLGFVLGGDPLRPACGRRWFVAARAGAAQAFVVTQALPARHAVSVEHFVRAPGAAYGAVEAAIACALDLHRAEGVQWGLLALAPLRGLEQASADAELLFGRCDWSHRAAIACERALRQRGERLYPARTLEHFKQKFNPTVWAPAYLAHVPGRLLPRMAVAALLELLPGDRWGLALLGAKRAALRLAGSAGRN